MNLLGATILGAIILVIFLGSRRAALLAILAGTLYLTQGQSVQILGFNMFAMRFIELAGFARLVARKEYSFKKINQIDEIFLLLYTYTTVVFLIRSEVDQAYQIGVTADAFLCYFTFRGLIRDTDDFQWLLRSFVFLLVPYTMLVLFESFTRTNPFASMGGVVLSGESWVRGGRIRCQGSFRHASLLGTLGATFVPLYIGLLFNRTARTIAVIGLLMCLLIVWASNSGGPLNTTAVGILGWLFWRLRRKMRVVRRLIVGGVVLMAIVMKAPIWYLPAKASALTGGDGWHRSYLMDVAFRNLDKWWIGGMPILETKDWFGYVIEITGAADITNQFLSFGLNAGVGGLLLFIFFLVIGFKKLGQSLAAVRETSTSPTTNEHLLWALGVVALAHMFNWLGITYFDQTYAIWLMQVAAISSLSEYCLLNAGTAAFEFPQGSKSSEASLYSNDSLPNHDASSRL